jgi:type III secretion protein N (ATPase)
MLTSVKRGQVIDGEVHDARSLAAEILSEALREAGTIRTSVRAEAAQILHDAHKLGERVLGEARVRAAATLPAPGEAAPSISATGAITEVVGLLARAEISSVQLGEVVHIASPSGWVDAEVVGFRGGQALLLPMGELQGIAARAQVVRSGGPPQIIVGESLLGRVLDGLGRPMDRGPELQGELWPVHRAAPSPMDRPAIERPIATGLRVIDGLLTLGEGQRIGLFAGSGVGKSTLLAQIAGGADVDVCVLCQVGERGRELGEMLAGPLQGQRHRLVSVCATSDASSLVRLHAAQVATAIAEWFRDRCGARVLLAVDSLTRVARAQREVGLAAGESPARHGYPPSVFALLPRLIERAGRTQAGSITGIYSVFVAGGDLDEPIADEVRGLVDGHIVLDRQLAARGHFPPVDVTSSVSRAMTGLVEPEHLAAAAAVRRHLAVYEEHRDLLTLGAYKAGGNRALDEAMARIPRIERFLQQGAKERSAFEDTLRELHALG